MKATFEESVETPATWSRRAFVNDDLRPLVAAADVLLVPTEGYGEREDLRFFPAGTIEFFDFLRSKVPPSVNVEVCSDDEDYKEVARHADVIYLPYLLVTAVFAPILVNLVTEYVKMRTGRREESTTVKTSLTVHDASSGKSMRLDYEGPASALKDTVLAGIQQIQSGSMAAGAPAIELAPEPDALPAPSTASTIDDEEHRSSQSTPPEVSKQVY